MSDRGAWHAVLDSAVGRYRRAGPFAWYFGYGKLGFDPVFREALSHGWWPDVGPRALRLLDLGCGQGLLGSLLAAAQDEWRAGRWPDHWTPPPDRVAYWGVDVLSRDVERARAALANWQPAPTLVCGDLRDTPLPPADLVVMLDVLHYIDRAAQDQLLLRVCDALRAGGGAGRLVMRVGDRTQRRGFAVARGVDRLVAQARRRVSLPDWGRPAEAWLQMLRQLGFTVIARPMSEGTPFANVLLIGQLAPS